jgi:hypothetical protein
MKGPMGSNATRGTRVEAARSFTVLRPYMDPREILHICVSTYFFACRSKSFWRRSEADRNDMSESWETN